MHIVSLPPEYVSHTRGVLYMELCEGTDEIFVIADIYDGLAEGLKTPEFQQGPIRTVTRAREWARLLSEQYLVDNDESEED